MVFLSFVGCVRARRTLFKKRNTQMVDARAKLLVVDGL